MTLLDYTAYDAIRAVLGVNSDELEDATLALELYSTHLLMELEGVSLLLPSEYVTVSAIDLGSRSAAQQRFYLNARLFATYAVAHQLAPGLPMFGPKDTTDGKAATGRFADSPYKVTLKEVEKAYDRLKIKLAEDFQALSASSATVVQRTLFGVSAPLVDPVTGS